jgi:hydroxyacylglutathione hydrolase
VNAIFSGDTLFNAGAGNCHNGGDPALLFATFVEQLAKLPGDTLVYPGHDYIENNLKFTLAREPDNADAKALLPTVAGHDPATSVVTTMAQEKTFNTFFRLTSASVIAKLREAFPDLPERPDAKTVFVKLRELRNTW